MSRIISYPYDVDIKDEDAWIGTEASTTRTRQYTAAAVAKYIRIHGKISIAGQMLYQYVALPLTGIGTMSLTAGGTDNKAFSTITQLVISEQDKTPQNVVAFLQYLINSDILIAKQNGISVFGHYKVTGYTVDAGNPSFYNLILTYIGGNGSLELDEYYDIVNFVKVSGIGDKSFIFTQANPTAVWTIQHNLGKFPSVSVVDTSNTMVEGLTDYIDDNNLTITFTAGFAGKAYLN